MWTASWCKISSINGISDVRNWICSFRNRQHQGRERLRSRRLPLPQQLTQETPQRPRSSGLPLPQQLARMTPQRLQNNEPKSQNMCATVTMRRTREQGTPKDRWQPEEEHASSIFAPSQFPAALPAVRSIRTYSKPEPCSLQASGSSESPSRTLSTSYLTPQRLLCCNRPCCRNSGDT